MPKSASRLSCQSNDLCITDLYFSYVGRYENGLVSCKNRNVIQEPTGRKA